MASVKVLMKMQMPDNGGNEWGQFFRALWNQAQSPGNLDPRHLTETATPYAQTHSIIP